MTEFFQQSDFERNIPNLALSDPTRYPRELANWIKMILEQGNYQIPVTSIDTQFPNGPNGANQVMPGGVDPLPSGAQPGQFLGSDPTTGTPQWQALPGGLVYDSSSGGFVNPGCLVVGQSGDDSTSSVDFVKPPSSTVATIPLKWFDDNNLKPQFRLNGQLSAVSPATAYAGLQFASLGLNKDYFNTVKGDGPRAYFRLDEVPTAGAGYAEQNDNPPHDSMGNYTGAQWENSVFLTDGAIYGDTDKAVRPYGTPDGFYSGGINFGVPSADISMTGPFTLEVWTMASGPGDLFRVGGCPGASTLGWGFMLSVNTSGDLTAGWWYTDSNRATSPEPGAVTAPGVVATSNYCHVVCTYDGVTLNLYVNGTLVATGSPTSGGGSGVNWTTGGNCPAGGYGAPRDEVAFYNKVLDAATILHHYDMGAGVGQGGTGDGPLSWVDSSCQFQTTSTGLKLFDTGWCDHPITTIKDLMFVRAAIKAVGGGSADAQMLNAWVRWVKK